MQESLQVDSMQSYQSTVQFNSRSTVRPSSGRLRTFGFLLVMLAACGLSGGCQSTTTVDYGYGMEFTEGNQ